MNSPEIKNRESTMSNLAVMLTIEGEFNEWKFLKNKCTKSLTDEKGIGVGIILKNIETKYGDYQMKFVLIFLDSAIKHRIKPINRFTFAEIRKEGLESILSSLGRKLVINLQREDQVKT